MYVVHIIIQYFMKRRTHLTKKQTDKLIGSLRKWEHWPRSWNYRSGELPTCWMSSKLPEFWISSVWLSTPVHRERSCPSSRDHLIAGLFRISFSFLTLVSDQVPQFIYYWIICSSKNWWLSSSFFCATIFSWFLFYPVLPSSSFLCISVS